MDLENLPPGVRWKEAIEDALAKVDAMILCVSPLSLESAWTSVELRIAIHRRVPIIPVLFESVPVEALPPAVREFQTIDFAAGAENIAAKIADALSATGAPTSIQRTCAIPDRVRELVILLDGENQPEIEPELAALHVKTPLIMPVQSGSLDTPLLSDLAREIRSVGRGVLVVGRGADRHVASLLLGALAVWLGPRRLTILEFSNGGPTLESAANITRAFHRLLAVRSTERC